MEEIEVVVAHNERATLRVGDVFLKIDTDQTRTDVEVGAMAMAPIPTPEVLWRKPPVLALAALPGTALGVLGEPSTASAAAWAAAGAAARMLHDAPLPPWPGKRLDEITSRLDSECEWLVTNGVLPTDMVTRNREIAEAAIRPWTPVFTHGDLQITHVFEGTVLGLAIHPYFPMTSRWMESGFNDTMHGILSMAWGVIIFVAVGVSAVAYRGWFRLYAIATDVVLIGFGAVSGIAIQGIEQNDTPWAGAFERINAYSLMAWFVVLAVMVIPHQLNRRTQERSLTEIPTRELVTV